MTAFVFRPITTWPGELTRSRRRSPFAASHAATLELLRREVRHLKRRLTEPAVIQLSLSDNDIRQDGLPRANARPATHPGVILTFDSTYGPLRYATDVFTDWHANLRAIALGLEALRRVDRYGITKGGEQYAGWRALEAETGGGVLERGRSLIAEHGGIARALIATHPDHGGTREDLEAVLAARDAGQ